MQRITKSILLVLFLAERVSSQRVLQVVALPTQRPVSTAPMVRTTNAPTMNPPTVSPISPPTLVPTTDAPSQAPMDPPTLLPTILPTVVPTVAPTIVPTESPSNAPSSLPPTVAPSISPSMVPTNVPTISPKPTTSTPAPTVSPRPTVAPTATHTLAPVQRTTSPTNVLQSATLNVVFRLEDDVAELDTKGQFDFESVTEAFIEQSIRQMDNLRIVDLGVAVYDQNVIGGQNVRRLLPLRIGVNVFLDYRSMDSNNMDDDDPNEWVGAAFNSEEKRDNFVRALRRRNAAAFGGLQGIRISVDGETPTEVTPVVNPPNEEDEGGIDFWIILVASIGGGMCIIGLLLVVWVVTGRNRSSSLSSKKTSTQSSPNHHYKHDNKNMSESQLQFAAEIRCEHRADDISTLGDPVGLMQYGVAPRDERTASVGADYDYAKHAGEIGRQNSTEGARSLTSGLPSTLGPIESLLGDDDRSFEQQFEILDAEQRFVYQVPPGKLGMVIDTPDGCPPLVHAIKPGSVLDGKVQVGDLLISVDHQNVTDWSAIQVSKWISARSDQQRTLVFGRHNRKRTESSVFLEDGSV